MYPYTMTNNTITVVIDGQPHNIKQGADNYVGVKKALLAEDWKTLKGLISPGLQVSEWTEGMFEYKAGSLHYAGEEIPSILYSRITQMAKEGKKPTGLMRFWERLQKNPSKRSIDMLFQFLQHVHIPIDDQGFILAYKGVRSDFKDIHSGTFTNTPGSVMSMARNKISDDPRTPCAEGFHVGALSYAQSFAGGGKVVVCRVDPEHVVCVPYDSSEQKVRVCEYKVIGLYSPGAELPSTMTDDGDLPDDESEEVDTEDENEDSEGSEDTEDDSSEEVVEPAEVKPSEVESSKLDPKRLELMNLEQLRTFAKAQGVKNVKGILGGKKALIEYLLKYTSKPDAKPDNKKPQQLKPAEFQVKTGAIPTGTKSIRELEAMNIDDLRKYATQVLKLVRASKIPGGKKALLEACKKLM